MTSMQASCSLNLTFFLFLFNSHVFLFVFFLLFLSIPDGNGSDVYHQETDRKAVSRRAGKMS